MRFLIVVGLALSTSAVAASPPLDETPVDGETERPAEVTPVGREQAKPQTEGRQGKAPEPMQPTQRRPSAEAERTVEAFEGQWTTTGTVKLPEQAQPVTVTRTVACESVAEGNAVACIERVEAAELGTTETSSLIAYDADTGTVRMVSVDSDGDLVERTGKWTEDQRLELRGERKLGEQQANELTVVTIEDDGTMSVRTVTTAPAGEQAIYEYEGKRDGTPQKQ